MRELRDAYYKLLCSPAQLDLCRQAHSVADLLAALRRLWGVEGPGDADLMHALGTLNQEDVPPEVAAGMAGRWLPRSYHVRTQRLAWCLPDGAPTEPFHDEYLSRCWQSTPLNQLITPRTSLKPLAACAQRVPRAQPAGFIFHLSRCGSTLLSGCLSELDGAAVFSESPVLTEILVDPALSPQEKRAHVQCLLDLKTILFPGRRVVVKWNAWDIFHAQLLRGAYPNVPAVALVRDPVEILASHQAQAGRHMSGDPSLAAVAPVFGEGAGGSVLEHRIGVLQGLMQGLHDLAAEPGVACIDYRQLDGGTVRQVAAMFGLRCDLEGQRRIAQRMQSNAKLPGIRFEPDGARKAAVFDAAQSTAIARRLSSLHRALLAATGPAAPAAHAESEREVADVR
ncbi:sulfotransferase family protein [Diaphorobacter nitroreducens]|uniref:sulfotransferase family protein n=1 Tax=Diaphorobacter nitroreducens TaxID=164759 RepID=UPI00289D1859|nr:sulfotransferase family protein [Diaphorobacter nitroreducens]